MARHTSRARRPEATPDLFAVAEAAELQARIDASNAALKDPTYISPCACCDYPHLYTPDAQRRSSSQDYCDVCQARDCDIHILNDHRPCGHSVGDEPGAPHSNNPESMPELAEAPRDDETCDQCGAPLCEGEYTVTRDGRAYCPECRPDDSPPEPEPPAAAPVPQLGAGPAEPCHCGHPPISHYQGIGHCSRYAGSKRCPCGAYGVQGDLFAAVATDYGQRPVAPVLDFEGNLYQQRDLFAPIGGGSDEAETRADPDYHEGRPVFRSNRQGGVTVLCPVGHLVTSIRKGEWAGSIWEAHAGDKSYTVQCIGKLPPIGGGSLDVDPSHPLMSPECQDCGHPRSRHGLEFFARYSQPDTTRCRECPCPAYNKGYDPTSAPEYVTVAAPPTTDAFTEEEPVPTATLPTCQDIAAAYAARHLPPIGGGSDEASAADFWAIMDSAADTLRQVAEPAPAVNYTPAALSDHWPDFSTREDLDAHAYRELELWAESSGDLYRQLEQPITANLRRHMERDTYDPERAEVAWLHYYDEAARRYGREFGSPGMPAYFPKSLRRQLAADQERHVRAKLLRGECGPLTPRRGVLCRAGGRCSRPATAIVEGPAALPWTACDAHR
jgi:hypothetical protein